MAKSIMQEEKECYITHDTLNLHKHHIYGNYNRNNSEKYGCWVWLRADWHNMAEYGVHHDIKLMNRLRKECQEKFEQLYGHDKFMKVFHHDYIEKYRRLYGTKN